MALEDISICLCSARQLSLQWATWHESVQWHLQTQHATPPTLGRPPLQLGNFDGGHRAKRVTCIKSNHNRQLIPSLLHYSLRLSPALSRALTPCLSPLLTLSLCLLAVFYEATQKCNMHFVAALLLTCAWNECTMRHRKDSRTHTQTHHTWAGTRSPRARTYLSHLLHALPINCLVPRQLKTRPQKVDNRKLFTHCTC